MPLYDYECDSCGEEFEVSLSLREYSNETICPFCRGLSRRVITRPILFCLPDHKRKWGTSLYRGEQGPKGFISKTKGATNE